MEPKESKKFSLNSFEWQSIGIGSLIAGAGAALTYLIEALSVIDFGEWTPLVASALAILSNIIRKYLAGK